MYEFIDITEQSPVNSLPTEAVSIDGQFIEEAIPGYRTLNVQGRESLNREITAYSVGAAHGERVRSTRYEARVITVRYQLIAESAADFREKMNILNNLLTSEDSDFIFNDEPDKFFSGIPVIEDSVEPGTNAVTGEWKIYCAYPFKRSVDVVTKSSEDTEGVVVNGNTAVFTIDYAGTIPAKPILQAEFAGAKAGGNLSEDGDCGFVAFMDTDENVIQLGNPEDPTSAQANAETLVNREFSEIAGWATSGPVWSNYGVTGRVSPGNISDPQWDKGKGLTKPYAKPTYGSGSATCFGPVLSWNAPAGSQVLGPDFSLQLVHRICGEKSTELGEFQCMVRDSQSQVVAGFVILKNKTGDKGTVKYIVNNAEVGSATVDLSYYNRNFGYCKKSAVYKNQYYNKKKKTWQDKKISGAKTRKVVDKYTYTQSSLQSSITKQDDTIAFKIGGLAAKSFQDSTLPTQAAAITMHYGMYKNKPALHTNAVQSIKLAAHPGSFETVKNTFQAGDIVEADCNDASVYLLRANTIEGQPAPNYGALGNDWESFELERGLNTISVIWSDWVDPNYKPIIRIMYNEVYI